MVKVIDAVHTGRAFCVATQAEPFQLKRVPRGTTLKRVFEEPFCDGRGFFWPLRNSYTSVSLIEVTKQSVFNLYSNRWPKNNIS
jgi:hypothetical protein